MFITFNLPNLTDKFIQGNSTSGTVKSAGLPNITGSFKCVDNLGDPVTGAFTGEVYGYSFASLGTGRDCTKYSFDASLSNPIYGNSNTVQPNALTARYIIKAFDGQTADSALIDVTQYANELAGKANRALDNLTQAGQDSFLERDFTIIYPNGGSEASPANVTANSRYVEPNPFPGYYVKCITEVFYNGQWGDPMFTAVWIPSVNNGNGVTANQLDDDNIIVQTGGSALLGSGETTGTPLNVQVAIITTAPCRVKVWKIGKIPD